MRSWSSIVSSSVRTSWKRAVSRPVRIRMSKPPEGRNWTVAPRTPWGSCADRPETAMMPNSRPLEPWTVMIRTASTSASGMTGLVARILSSRCSVGPMQERTQAARLGVGELAGVLDCTTR